MGIDQIHMDNPIYHTLDSMFPNGLNYDDAIQLCLSIYCTSGILPEVPGEDCTKEAISKAFSQLSTDGVIIHYKSDIAVLYGANFHDFESSGHWVEIIGSIFKQGMAPNIKRVQELLLADGAAGNLEEVGSS